MPFVALWFLVLSVFAPQVSDAVFFISDEKPSPEIKVEESYEGDLVLRGKEELRIQNKKFIIYGNVYLKGASRLILDNAILEIKNYPVPEMVLAEESKLSAKESLIRIFGETRVKDKARVEFERVVFSDVLEIGGDASASVSNSWIFEDYYGAVRVKDQARVSLLNSVLGGAELVFPLSDEPFEAANLHSGQIEEWSSGEAIRGKVGWGLLLRNVELKENPGKTGDVQLGWGIIADSAGRLSVRDSALNRFSMRFAGGERLIKDLKIGEPVSFEKGAVKLENVTVRGEWGIEADNSELLLEDSQGLGITAIGESKISVIRSDIVGLEAYSFSGGINFEDSSLSGRFWIFENSDFAMRGSVSIDSLDPRFGKNSKLIREYTVVLRKGPEAIANVPADLLYRGRLVDRGVSNAEGVIYLEAKFDDIKNSHREVRNLVIEDEDFNFQGQLSIFSPSPFIIDLGPDLRLESFSFGVAGEEFFVEAFLVNRGTEDAKNIEAKLESYGLDLISPRTIIFDKLSIGQKEPVLWRLVLPKKGDHPVYIRIYGENFPEISKQYTFERGKNWAKPVILAQEYFEGEEVSMSFWSCGDEGCFESSEPALIEEKNGDMALKLEGHSFALLNKIYGEELISLYLMLERGSSNVSFRYNASSGGLERYFVTLGAGLLTLNKQTKDGFAILAQETAPLVYGKWYILGVSHKDGGIQVLLDEKQVIKYSDEKPLGGGVTAIEALPDSTVWFDDLVLKGEKKLPSEAGTPYLLWLIIFSVPVIILFAAAMFVRLAAKRLSRNKPSK